MISDYRAEIINSLIYKEVAINGKNIYRFNAVQLAKYFGVQTQTIHQSRRTDRIKGTLDKYDKLMAYEMTCKLLDDHINEQF